MAKLLSLLRRLPTLSQREFQDHWLDYHARFARENPHVVRCVQCHAIADDPTRAALAQAGASEVDEGYDGCEILWFHDLAGLRAALAHQAFAAAAADMERFVDLDRSAVVVATEHVHIEPEPPSPIVFVECLARTAAIDRQTFSERWLHHAGIAHKANAAGYLSGYIQNHALVEGPGDLAGAHGLGRSTEDWDGVMTGFFQSVAVAKALFTSPLASEEAFEDERSFIDHSKAVLLLTRRHVIKEALR